MARTYLASLDDQGRVIANAPTYDPDSTEGGLRIGSAAEDPDASGVLIVPRRDDDDGILRDGFDVMHWNSDDGTYFTAFRVRRSILEVVGDGLRVGSFPIGFIGSTDYGQSSYLDFPDGSRLAVGGVNGLQEVIKVGEPGTGQYEVSEGDTRGRVLTSGGASLLLRRINKRVEWKISGALGTATAFPGGINFPTGFRPTAQWEGHYLDTANNAVKALQITPAGVIQKPGAASAIGTIAASGSFACDETWPGLPGGGTVQALPGASAPF